MDAQGLRLITALKLCILATKKDGTPLYSDREQYIFSELYGLEGNEIQNMISLGDKLGLSRERIRQLKVKVFKKFGILRKNYGSRSKKGEIPRFELSHNALNRKPQK